MNEDWNEMMAYAPLLEDEVETDYQKVEDFTESEVETVEEIKLIMTCDTEAYLEATEISEKTVLCSAEEAWCSNEEAEDLADDIDMYDDYQSMPEVPADIYSCEEY